jgi:probable HAF family extracellular repeat protein
LNEHGVGAGYFMDAAMKCHGYTVKFREHSFTELPIPFSNQATGVNDRGDVSGFFIDNAGKTHGFLLKDNVF